MLDPQVTEADNTTLPHRPLHSASTVQVDTALAERSMPIRACNYKQQEHIRILHRIPMTPSTAPLVVESTDVVFWTKHNCQTETFGALVSGMP